MCQRAELFSLLSLVPVPRAPSPRNIMMCRLLSLIEIPLVHNYHARSQPNKTEEIFACNCVSYVSRLTADVLIRQRHF